jgi:hypothetical protein
MFMFSYTELQSSESLHDLYIILFEAHTPLKIFRIAC